jgi:tetratricopeptide (TPR) repeat protein
MMHRLVRLVGLVLAICGALRASAQSSSAAAPSADQLQRAAALFAQSDWSGALASYRALVAAYPTHALSRLRVGVSLMELHQLPAAESNIRAAETLGAPPQAAYRLAQVLAEQRRADEAMVELQRAITLGLPLAPLALAQDVHLSALKGHARWAATIDALDAVARPCLHDARHREFDFWIGDWDVRSIGQPAVGPAARNTVTQEYNGCVIKEHWVAPSGSEGESYNLFDRSVGQWRQTWVDNTGGQHDYRGGLVNGNMTYVGDTPAPNGQRGRLPTRLTFFHLSRDSVRQFSQVSSDSGRTWTTAYDLLYVRRR